MDDPNLSLLRQAAGVLRPLLDEVVFVGGCTTGLLITDSAAAALRTTDDVDAIVEIASYADYVGVFAERLRNLGLKEDSGEGALMCRWRHGQLKIDLMPLTEGVLGFTNQWYPDAIRLAHRMSLSADLSIHVITAPYFVATKLDAFRSRGAGDYSASHDIEDIVAVIDGRLEIVDEIATASADVSAYIRAGIKALIDDRRFVDTMPGLLAPDEATQDRLPILIERLTSIANE